MRSIPTRCDEFRAALARDESPWGRAKAEAFERLRALSPGSDGPSARATLAALRGRHAERIPPDWRAAFLEAGHQWLGFLEARRDADTRATARAPRWSFEWWVRPIAPFGRHPVIGPLLASRLTLVIALVLAAVGARHLPTPAPPDRPTPPRIPPATAHPPGPAAITGVATALDRSRERLASGRDADLAALQGDDAVILREWRDARRTLLHGAR